MKIKIFQSRVLACHRFASSAMPCTASRWDVKKVFSAGLVASTLGFARLRGQASPSRALMSGPKIWPHP